MLKLFERCGEIASVGVIVDFSEDREIYVVGTPADIKTWAYNACPMKVTEGLMRHSNKTGNLVKDVNRFMKVKRELNDIADICDRLCNPDDLCNGNCNAVLDELSQLYDTSEYGNIVKNYIIYFLFSKFRLYQSEFRKKIGVSVKNNHERAVKYIELFRAETEKFLSPFKMARAKNMFSITSAIGGKSDIFDSTSYKLHTENGSTKLFVANDSFITLLDIYRDIMSSAGRIVTNCEICGQLMITNRANASLTCGKKSCKKERLYKANDDYKRRAMKDPIEGVYLDFDNKCRSYRKKLSGYPALLEKYNKALDEQRGKIKAVKRGLTKDSSTDDIERYNQMCFDACQDLQDYSRELKAKVMKKTDI